MGLALTHALGGLTRPLGGPRNQITMRSIFRTRTGIWYDPQDLTTLFQDFLGTLPVYRPGTGLVDPPVGLMLDKSRGLELGPEPTNGLPADFDDLTTWTARGTATVGAGGLAAGLKPGVGGGDIFRFASAAFPSETYLQVRVRVKRVSTVGSVAISHPNGGSTWGTGKFVINLSKLSDNWEWIDEFHPAVSNIVPWTSASNGSGGLLLTSNTLAGQESLSIYVDSFFQSVRREIKGYHAYQTTTTARPTLSGRYNILTATETLSTQSVTTVATNYTLSFSGTGTITLSGTATGTYSAGTHTITCKAGTLTCTVAGTVTKADLRVKRDGSSLPAYQSVTNANTYDTAGFPLFLKRDKVDDDLIVLAPAITGAWAHGTIDGPVIGTVAIPAGEYHPFGIEPTFGLPDCTQWIAIDGTLSASEQAMFERYVYSKARQLIDVKQFGSVRVFANWLRERADITGIDLSRTDLSNATNLFDFLRGSVNITEIDLSGTNLKIAPTFFAPYASKLETVNITGLTFSGSSWTQAFVHCSNLTTIKLDPSIPIPQTSFTNTFLGTNLNQASIDGILVCINTAGTSNGTFTQSGGSAPSATGEAAITAMRSRGWTIAVTGGF